MSNDDRIAEWRKRRAAGVKMGAGAVSRPPLDTASSNTARGAAASDSNVAGGNESASLASPATGGNDDRIAKWRERRLAGRKATPVVPAPDANVARNDESPSFSGSVRQNTGGLATSSSGDEAEAQLGQVSPSRAAALLMRMLEVLRAVPRNSVADRRAAYDALEEALNQEEALSDLDSDAADFHRRLYRTTIRLLENDIRANIDVFAPGYAPADLSDQELRLSAAFEMRAQRRKQQEARDARRHASRQDIALDVELAPDEAADLAKLRKRVAMLHATQQQSTESSGRSRLFALLPLLILQLQTMHGESRFALVWALFGPAVLLGLISSLYLLTGTQFILGMDVATFSLLGATTWIMFRQIIFRCSTSYVSARGLLNLQQVNPLMCLLVQASIYLGIYLFVFFILISVGVELNLVTLPDNWLGFVACVFAMATGGTAIGLLFGTIATGWHFFLRLAAVIERFLEVFSGVFFVSEQLPEQYRPFFLWSPFAHGMQLLRSAYFESYKSSDASVSYFLTSLVLLMVVALTCDRLVRNRVQPM
ncbi:ABC transporter permease [Paraburkholderia metrosideri]|uniref:Sugar ABC transporter permease n=1 Tax=Paraburkholderia metrosideri TaxID=580937 RepID=A0ABM8P2R7_9BURK|nr:sugar ABC transporter permease [Paraburkholderia metrosideri]CAD6554773.1 hypothetical protein LMG28140_05530 [Paraburkholderia metrosideri]